MSTVILTPSKRVKSKEEKLICLLRRQKEFIEQNYPENHPLRRIVTVESLLPSIDSTNCLFSEARSKHITGK